MTVAKKIAIVNGLLINPNEPSPQKTDLYIADNKIVAHGKPPADFKADITLDAKGAWVCPGLIDLSANLGDPRHDLAQETHAAVQHGITTLCQPPNVTHSIDHAEIAMAIEQCAVQAHLARVVTIGALTQDLAGHQLAPMAALKQTGCVGVSNGKQAITDTRVLYNAFAYAATFNLPVLFYAEDFYLAQGGCAHNGIMSTRLGLPGIPASAEIIAVNTAIELQRATGVRLHLCRLSCAESVALVAAAQKRGQSITADVAIHHLYLTEMDIDGFNSLCHTVPPLRGVSDQTALLEGIKNGVISAICSDHEPCGTTAKLQPFPSSVPGISGLDTLLSLILGLREKLSLTPNQIISLVTTKPASILGLAQGTLNIGTPADICIIQPDTSWTLTPQNITSRGKNTPFLNWPMQGVVQTTLVDGVIVFEQK
jgi:dihydroorotase